MMHMHLTEFGVSEILTIYYITTKIPYCWYEHGPPASLRYIHLNTDHPGVYDIFASNLCNAVELWIFVTYESRLNLTVDLLNVDQSKSK